MHDSGDYHAMLDRAPELVDVERWRAERIGCAGAGRRIGIGSTLDSGTNNFGQARLINKNLPFSGNGEAAICRLDLMGEVNACAGYGAAGTVSRNDDGAGRCRCAWRNAF